MIKMRWNTVKFILINNNRLIVLIIQLPNNAPTNRSEEEVMECVRERREFTTA